MAQLFLDILNKTTVFNPEKALLYGVGNMNIVPPELVSQLPQDATYGRVDLLPSSIQLINVQDNLQDISTKTHYNTTPMGVIKKYIESYFDNYDYVLIDCPPNLGFVTQNGLEVSDYYIIPTVPDRLSTYGIPQIARRIDEFRQKRNLPIECLGVIITKFQTNSTQHKLGLERLPTDLQLAFQSMKEGTPHIFEASLPQTNASAEAMVFDRKIKNYKEKYGIGKVVGIDGLSKPAHKHSEDLAQEIVDKIEMRLKQVPSPSL